MDEKQTITIKDRKFVSADGVIDVEGFSDEYLIVNTKYGKLNIEGEELKIQELLQADGKISVSGKITAVFFKEESMEKNFIKKLFK